MVATLPAYDALQTAFHRAFEPELHAALDGLAVPRGGRVLDAPCGDGFYARRLADAVGPEGLVTLIDANPAYLDRARKAVRGKPAEVRAADVFELPFSDATFDLVWCAQSLITLPDAGRALREFARVTKPGGRIAVLEADQYHHVILPWPVGLELAVQRVLHRYARARYGSGSRLAPARHLKRTLTTAGWKPTRKVTVAADRQAPFRPREAEFLTLYLRHLANLVRDELPTEHRAAFDRLAEPASEESFPNRPDAELTCLNSVHVGTRVATERPTAR